MKALVIGANGFLGRNLVRKCLLLGWNVDCVFNKEKKFIPKECKTFHIDDLEEIKDQYDAVFLLSAFIPEDKTIADMKLLEVNVKIPMRVSVKFKKSKIVFSSSVSVYGIHNLIIRENSSFNNPDSYALSKLSAEFVLRFNVNYQIVRFSSIYGEGMTHKTFIPKLIEQARKNKKLLLYGKGSRLQNYVYIEDAVGYLISAASQKKSGIYLGVGERSYSNTEVARQVQKFFPGCEVAYSGKDTSPSFAYDNLLTQKMLKFKPRFSLEQGIRSMLDG